MIIAHGRAEQDSYANEPEQCSDPHESVIVGPLGRGDEKPESEQASGTKDASRESHKECRYQHGARCNNEILDDRAGLIPELEVSGLHREKV